MLQLSRNDETTLNNRGLGRRWIQRHWSVSRVTAERALAVLAAEGIVERRQRAMFRLTPEAQVRARCCAVAHYMADGIWWLSCERPIAAFVPQPLSVVGQVNPRRSCISLFNAADAMALP